MTKRFRSKLDSIAQKYPPRIQVDLDDLDVMLSAIADGGIILSKIVYDPKARPRQLLLYLDFVRLVV